MVADVSIVKHSVQNYAAPCRILTYVIVISNSGPGFAENVELSDPLPECLQDGEFSIDGGTSWNPWDGCCNMGTLPYDSYVAVLIRGNVSKCAGCSISNTAFVSSTTPDPNLNNNQSTKVNRVIRCC